MNKLDKQYTDLLQDILDNGVTKQDRTGTGTISVFGRQIRHDMKDGFPLLTTKKMPFKTIVTELLWFLRGDTNIKYLIDNNCHIWNGDAYKRYWNNIGTSEYNGDGPTSIKLPTLTQEEFIDKIKTDNEFAKKWGELGPIYGKQWRQWGGLQDLTDDDKPIYLDQIQNLINDLKTNPDSRRLMVNAWNVGELDQMVLPPCHYGFQVYTRELSLEERKDFLYEKFSKMTIPPVFSHTTVDDDLKNNNIPTRAISLMWNQRSVDTFLGLPFNIASYGLLLEIIAKEVNMVPDELVGNLGDVHLYSNHIDAAKEQIGREYSFSERLSMLRQAMTPELYEKRLDGIMPFGGGLNEYFDMYQIPYTTREPFELPTFDCPAIDEIPHTTFDELIFRLQPCDFYMDDYQSHSTIKAPLSN